MQHLDDSYTGNSRDKGVVSKEVPIGEKGEENSRDADVEARECSQRSNRKETKMIGYLLDPSNEVDLP